MLPPQDAGVRGHGWQLDLHDGRLMVGAFNRVSIFGGILGPSSDLTGDGRVGIRDLLRLLGAWGLCRECPEDLDGDRLVSTSDLVMLIEGLGSGI